MRSRPRLGARGVDRRDGDPRPEKYLRRHQDGGGGPLPALLAQPAAARDRAEDVALLSQADDDPEARAAFAADNLKANEYLHRRVAIEDVVDAHLLAAERAPAIGFGLYVISATTPFRRDDAARLRTDAAAVAAERAGAWQDEYARRGWRMAASIDRVYDNALARRELGWRPKWDFDAVVARLTATGDLRGPLARLIGEKGYHPEAYAGRPYPVGRGTR